MGTSAPIGYSWSSSTSNDGAGNEARVFELRSASCRGEKRCQLGGKVLDTWVPILIVETDLRDIGWVLFREKFGLAEDEPKLEDLQVVQLHGRPPMKIYAKYSVLRRKLLELGLDEKKLPFVPSRIE